MKLKFTLLTLFFMAISFAQVTNEGRPYSWDNDLEEVAPIQMPKFDLERIKAEDIANEGKAMPWRFGHQFMVYNDLSNSGVWTTLDNGDRVWRIRYKSKGAKTLNFWFTDFYMPEGGKIYLYNSNKTDLLGAYDSQQNNEQNVLGTWLVTGDDIYIEYFEPADKAGEGRLEITKIVHGYRSMGAESLNKSVDDGLNQSGNCNMDVNCSIPAINTLKDINKKAVAIMIVGGGSFCTGALINNTANNGTPYFLTANHCIEDPWTGQLDNPAFWSFRFNWISQNPVCATTANSTNMTGYYQTTSGAELKARRENSDFLLLEITANLPTTWNLTWAGWDRSTTVPSSTFGIHHPSGDIMKVCRDANSPVSDNSQGNVWVIQDWDQGVTEGGSSGSPLFDNNGRIIGQLWGGEASCYVYPNGTTGTMDNDDYDEYGRLNASWNGDNTNTTRLKNWLDPGNTNAMTVDYLTSEMLSTGDNLAMTNLQVYPNPSNGLFTIVGSNSEVTYVVYNILGQQVKSGTVNAGSGVIDLSASSNGVYVLKVIDAANGSQSSFKLIKE